jgi:lysine 2,3-aminomutase
MTATQTKNIASSGNFEHRALDETEFWRNVQLFSQVGRDCFLDYKWQTAHTIASPAHLHAILTRLSSDAFVSDVLRGLALSPMQVRITPYVLSLINWRDPVNCPIRRQYIPLGSEATFEHPMCSMDPLAEHAHAPIPSLVHRYLDRVLFLPVTVCPVYCQFCTRSRVVGPSTRRVIKDRIPSGHSQWRTAFTYVASHPEVEDVIVSGGDTFMLSGSQIMLIGNEIFKIPHVRRIRFATKGFAVLPMKVLSDTSWLDALVSVAERWRRDGRDFAVHTHINHPSEITAITKVAADMLTSHGITIRNQSVLLKHVNDSATIVRLLCLRLAFVNIHPYYLYQHDLVPGTDHLRTAIADAIAISKQIQGWTAGFNTPRIVVDLPGGGGKRDITSYEFYDRRYGISVFSAATMDHRLCAYFDPLWSLDRSVSEEWLSAPKPTSIVQMVLRHYGYDEAGMSE